MERDLNGIPIRDAATIASRRVALEMSEQVERALATGAVEKRRIEVVDAATYKPKAKWTRKDGSTGQREPWQRELSGHKAGQKRKARNAPSNTSPTA